MANNLKTKVTVEIDTELLQVVRTLVHWNPNITLKGFIETSMIDHLKTYPDAYKHKEAIQKLRGGRPLKI